MIEKKPTSTTMLACATMTTQCRGKAGSKPVVAIEKAEKRWDDEWDRPIEEDAKAGRLAPLWAEAEKEITEEPLDEILDD